MPIAELMSLMAAGERLLNEHASASALRDHLALVNAQLKVAVDENERLKKRVAELVDLSSDLAGQLKTKAIGQEFEEEGGVLFKRNPRGGYHKVPYCPKCRLPLGTMNPAMPYACTQQCGFISDIFQHDVPALIATLPA